MRDAVGKESLTQGLKAGLTQGLKEGLTEGLTEGLKADFKEAATTLKTSVPELTRLGDGHPGRRA